MLAYAGIRGGGDELASFDRHSFCVMALPARAQNIQVNRENKTVLFRDEKLEVQPDYASVQIGYRNRGSNRHPSTRKTAGTQRKSSPRCWQQA